MKGWVAPFVRYNPALGRVPPPGSVPTAGMQVLRGLPGPPGNGEVSYTHPQPVASTTWTVNHNLGYRPSVSALSVGGKLMLADVVHTSLNQAVISFDQPTAGLAVCS